MKPPHLKQRHFSMLRDFHLADWFTLANAFCGTGAIFAAMRFLQEGKVRDLLVGMALIPLAFVFDALDGRIARWRQKSLHFASNWDWAKARRSCNACQPSFTILRARLRRALTRY